MGTAAASAADITNPAPATPSQQQARHQPLQPPGDINALEAHTGMSAEGDLDTRVERVKQAMGVRSSEVGLLQSIDFLGAKRQEQRTRAEQLEERLRIDGKGERNLGKRLEEIEERLGASGSSSLSLASRLERAEKRIEEQEAAPAEAAAAEAAAQEEVVEAEGGGGEGGGGGSSGGQDGEEAAATGAAVEGSAQRAAVAGSASAAERAVEGLPAAESEVEEPAAEREEEGGTEAAVGAAGAGSGARAETVEADSLEPPSRRTSGRKSIDPDTRARLDSAKQYGNEKVGKRVSIYWVIEERWFEGTVMDYSPADLQHCVKYDDGDQGRYYLGREEALGQLRFLSPEAPAAGSSRGSGGGRLPAATSATTQPRPRGGVPEEPHGKRQKAAGRLVLVPANVYPQYECTEHAGRGWTGKIISQSQDGQAQIRFLYATDEDGVAYEPVWLPHSAYVLEQQARLDLSAYVLDPTPLVIDSLIGSGAHEKGFRLARAQMRQSGRVDTVFCWPDGRQSSQKKALAHASRLGVPAPPEAPWGAERKRAPRHVWHELVVRSAGWVKDPAGGGRRSGGEPIVAWVKDGATRVQSARAAYDRIPTSVRPERPEWMWKEGEQPGDEDDVDEEDEGVEAARAFGEAPAPTDPLANAELALRAGWAAGSRLECYCHRDRVWTDAKVLKARGEGITRELRVHYMSWNSKYDEWVQVSSGRLRAAQTTTSAAEARPHEVEVLDGYMIESQSAPPSSRGVGRADQEPGTSESAPQQSQTLERGGMDVLLDAVRQEGQPAQPQQQPQQQPRSREPAADEPPPKRRSGASSAGAGSSSTAPSARPAPESDELELEAMQDDETASLPPQPQPPTPPPLAAPFGPVQPATTAQGMVQQPSSAVGAGPSRQVQPFAGQHWQMFSAVGQGQGLLISFGGANAARWGGNMTWPPHAVALPPPPLPGFRLPVLAVPVGGRRGHDPAWGSAPSLQRPPPH